MDRSYYFEDGFKINVPNDGYLSPEEIKSYEEEHGLLDRVYHKGNWVYSGVGEE